MRTLLDPAVQLHDAELTAVREQLDNLTRRRSMTGLTSSEEARYHELCVGERALMDMSGLGVEEPSKLDGGSSRTQRTKVITAR
jgi:hypothetical protein